jgi:large subunit ribosomal protein L15
MATRLRKSRRQRGSRYCGWGQIGQHRQSGSRGGIGAAGKHKHFWIRTVIEEPSHYGHDSFYLINRHPVRKWLNVRDLDGILGQHGNVKEKDTKPTLDLTSLGFHKLLGGGKVSSGFKVRIERISQKAKQKIEEVGGEVLLFNEHNTKR